MKQPKDPPAHADPSPRRLPIGAEVVPGGVHFRVWAPGRERVAVLLDGGGGVPLGPEPGGYFSGLAPGLGPGARYRYQLDGGDAFPDPASRWQPDGPHGPSAVVDPGAFRWTDGDFPGLGPRGQVVYELHVGTFTPEGTFASAAAALPALRDLGITVVELMPVADFPGRFGWGYDGVDLFAPYHGYGAPDDLRRLVDRAHGLGLGVILDVVYNHLGPDGCYLGKFAKQYFTDRYPGEWGDPINFDGPDSAPVREFYLANVRCWIEEYRFDGLRLDATQSIHDAGPRHVLRDLADAARQAAGRRAVYLVAENEPQEGRLVRPPAAGGHGLDALWNDDFHHSAIVALTGRSEAYYSDHRGAPQELVSAARFGYLFQGQRYAWQKKGRGTPCLDLPPTAFVHYLENHDQVANTVDGRRLHQRTSPGRLRTMTALLCLGPQTPMLFQGQEFGSTAPFLYFADHQGDLGEAVRKGRGEFLRQFPSYATPEAQAALPDPGAADEFARCKLDWGERETPAGRAMLALHGDLLRLRRMERALRAQGRVEGAVLDAEAFALRFFDPGGDGPAQEAGDRLLLVNLGRDLRWGSVPEPLLAPPEGRRWRLRWSSEDPRYGGAGTAAPIQAGEAGEGAAGLCLPGHAAVLLATATLDKEDHDADA